MNDNRKAYTQFIINLCKKGAINVEQLLDILYYFINKTLEYIDMDNKTNEVEEITEMMKVSSIIDKKEEISQKIKTLKTQLKKPGLDLKTMQAYNKEIIELRTTLRKMK